MIARLPRWVWAGGFFLAFVAGAVNAVGFLGFEHQGLSHVTGTTTLLGAAAAQGRFAAAGRLALLIAAFFAGAVLAGVIVRDSVLRLTPQYGACLALESALLFAAVPFLSRGRAAGEWLALCACGLQNAMASTYSGAVVRTTHLTGLFTDLGIMSGHRLRGLPFDVKRAKLYAAILGGFASGAAGGALLFGVWGYDALLVPAALVGAAGVLHMALYPRLLREAA